MCKHKPEGRVTNQPGEYDPNRPHASIYTCSRKACVDASIKWAAGETNETAVYVSFKRGIREN